jgi:DNA-binding CsgD family transcriptional regulator
MRGYTNSSQPRPRPDPQNSSPATCPDETLAIAGSLSATSSRNLTIEQVFRYNAAMGLRQRLLRLFGYDPQPRLTFRVEAELLGSLHALAEREQRDPLALAAELLAGELATRYSSDERTARWEMLSERERQVAALSCLGYSAKQIALGLHLSTATVQKYRRSALRKMGVRNQQALRQALDGWDFSDWDR